MTEVVQQVHNKDNRESSLFEAFFLLQHKSCTYMFEYLNEFNKILANLQNLDEILDEDKILLLLKSIPDLYENYFF